MRTKEQIDLIKRTQSDPIQLHNVLDTKKIDFLLNYYYAQEKIEKNTGPKVVYVKEGDNVIDDILVQLRKDFGNFKVRACHFFDVENPHILHIDDGKDLPNTYKAFTIPLWVESGDCDKIKLVMFDQYYYGGPVKFFKEEVFEEEVIFYNTHLYEYTDVENLVNTNIPNTIKTKMLSHLKDKWLEGLSVHSCFSWTIGSIIAFDSLRIHCSSNFKNAGIKRKIGLSIFTEI